MESWNEQLKTKILESEFSIKEISDKTKIPTKFIEAIEKADFKSLPAEIFAKSQIERLFKFLGIDPSDALKDYEGFISPPEILSEDEITEDKNSTYQNFLNNLNFPKINNPFFKYGIILLISIFLIMLMFAITDNEEEDPLENIEIKNTTEPLEIENQDPLLTQLEAELFYENEGINNQLASEENLKDVSPKVITRKIEIVITGESWVEVFDKNERLIFELLQTGSYELSGISPLRFKIGYAPATDLYIDDQKVSLSGTIKGASNTAHFWVKEENKVESIRD